MASTHYINHLIVEISGWFSVNLKLWPIGSGAIIPMPMAWPRLREALMVAIIAGDVDETHRLLSNGADVNSKGAKMTLIRDGREFKLRSCPLLWAVVQFDAATVKVLLEAGADPTMSTAFFTHAVKSGDEEILRDLLEAVAGEAGILGGDFHIHGSFLQAARSAPHLLNILMQYGADINGMDSEGDTDLMKALRRKVSFCVVERLLAFGANVNLSNSCTGITPINSSYYM